MRFFLSILLVVSLLASVLPAQSLSTAKKVSVEIILSSDKVQVGSTAQVAIQLSVNEN